jgi:hypothetical protein
MNFHGLEANDKTVYPDECAGEEEKYRQVGGNHYQVAKMQVWDIIDAYHLDPYTANIIKYALRFPYKAGRQDIEKLIHYAEKLHRVYDEVKEHYYAGA